MKTFTEQLAAAIFNREIARIDGEDKLVDELFRKIAVLRAKIEREALRRIA